jgi:hypothetical protein
MSEESPQAKAQNRAAERTRLPLTVLESFRQRLSPTDRWSADDREAVMAELFPGGPELRDYVWRFLTLIVLSTLIAALGLLSNSAAVVIGAMLGAPLMTPILGNRLLSPDLDS